MLSFRARASVEKIGSPPVVTEPDHGRVASPCAAAVELSVNEPAWQELFTAESCALRERCCA